MPLIAYVCPCGRTVKKFTREAKNAPGSVVCDKCGLQAQKILSAPTSGSKVVIDNGVQARAVEIIPNIIELNQERSKKDYSEN